MKIIKKCKLPKKHTAKSTCWKCESVLLVDDKDVYNTTMDSTALDYRFKCPVCGALNHANSEQVARVECRKSLQRILEGDR